MRDFVKAFRTFALRVVAAGLGRGLLAGASNAAPYLGFM
jgi:hypothetical protein